MFYWRDKRGHEVDFVIATQRKRPAAIECKWSANNFDPTNLIAFRYQHPEGDKPRPRSRCGACLHPQLWRPTSALRWHSVLRRFAFFVGQVKRHAQRRSRKAVECWSELCAACLSFSGRRMTWRTILKSTVLKKVPPATVCFATTLAATSGQFDLFRNPHKRWRFLSNGKVVLITRDIPTLTNPSPTAHQRRFQSPLSARNIKVVDNADFFSGDFRVTFSG